MLTYDQPLDGTSVPATTDFSVLQNATPQGTPTGVSVSGSTVTISLATPVSLGDVVTLSYSGTAIKNLGGQSAATLTNAPVTVGGTSPTPPSGPITCPRPRLLTTRPAPPASPPRPPPPPVVFLGTDPADGSILGSVGSITLQRQPRHQLVRDHGHARRRLAAGSPSGLRRLVHDGLHATAPGTYTIDA